MPTRIRAQWLALVAVLLALAQPAAGAGKSVLLLQQDDDAWPAYQAFYGGFQSVLAREFGADVVIYRENLDIRRFPDAAYRDALRRWYLVKYHAVPLDAIVALGPATLNFAVAARRDLWQAVPVVFAGGNEETAAAAAAAGNATGLMLRVESGRTLALARALFPHARHLALVGGRDVRDDYFLGFEKAIAQARQDFSVIDLRGLPMAEVLTRVAELPSDSIVHYTSISVDGAGQRFVPREALAKIAAQSRAPVFGDLDSYLDTGAVGGHMTDIRAFGAAVAMRVVDALGGTAESRVPRAGEGSWSAPVVDWRALQRWGVDEGRLPPGTDVRLRVPSLWEEHRGAIAGTTTAFGLLLTLVLWLLHERRRRIRAEAEAGARMTELARANRISAAGELAAAIAHDLGQPLAAIQSNVESIELLLEADPPRLDEARAALADVRRDDQRAADVIGGLRSLYRKSEARPDLVRVDGLVGDMIRMAAGIATRRRVLIESDLDPRPMTVRADAIQLQQVFVNLMLNALDAIPDEAVQRRVVLSARRVEGGIRLAVADSGPGVPEADRARIFEPFYTTKANGTGVGLAIVRRIVESLGARVDVSRSPAGGAEFSFVLPEAAVTP